MTIDDLYQVEEVILVAAKGVLADATEAAVFENRCSDNKDSAPWLEVALDIGSSNGHMHPGTLDGKCWPDMWSGRLSVRVVTSRYGDGQQARHRELRGQVAAAFVPGRGLFTEANLPHHQLIDCRQAGMPFTVKGREDLDVSEMQFDVVIAIRPSAWVAVGVDVAPE